MNEERLIPFFFMKKVLQVDFMLWFLGKGSYLSLFKLM